MTTAPISTFLPTDPCQYSTFLPTDPRHYSTSGFADLWEDREALACFAVAAVVGAESVRAGLLGHHRRARALLAAAERGLPTDEATAKIWASELWVLRGTLVAGPDLTSCALISHRNAHLAYALVEQLYTPHPLLLEWYLHRARTAPPWRRHAAVQAAREYLLSVQYDPTDRYTLGVLEVDRHAGKYAHQKIRLFHVGSAFGDSVGQWLLMAADDTDLARHCARRSHSMQASRHCWHGQRICRPSRTCGSRNSTGCSVAGWSRWSVCDEPAIDGVLRRMGR
ncbi:hypothetical protein ACIBEH_32555 [Nocardia salmonicida]|uniref:hypothetical protein n=1 Tax=Nocardia salmonicida TaxID=53431 RepID=UPI00378DF713